MCIWLWKIYGLHYCNDTCYFANVTWKWYFVHIIIRPTMVRYVMIWCDMLHDSLDTGTQLHRGYMESTLPWGVLWQDMAILCHMAPGPTFIGEICGGHTLLGCAVAGYDMMWVHDAGSRTLTPRGYLWRLHPREVLHRGGCSVYEDIVCGRGTLV